MSEGGDDVEGSQINNVFCIYKSVKNSIHFKQVDYLDQLKTTTTGKIMETLKVWKHNENETITHLKNHVYMNDRSLCGRVNLNNDLYDVIGDSRFVECKSCQRIVSKTKQSTPTPTPTPTTEIEIDWSVNKQIRLKNGDVVLLSIEIEIDSEMHYFPFTNDGLNLAFDLYHEHIVEMRSDVNFNWSLLADNMIDSNDYITMKDLNPREWLNVYNRLHQQTIGQ